jgi:carbonic anhydrase
MHTESEHTFEGGHYDLEMQFVHTAPGPDGTEKVLIIACFYQVCLSVCLSFWEGVLGGVCTEGVQWILLRNPVLVAPEVRV